MFAATVLATYDNEFYNDYKGMIEMMIRDYAGPSDNDSEYCRFRAYDMYEGHSWAGGYADNDSGNNQESASESLFSWVSMYLWGVLTEMQEYLDLQMKWKQWNSIGSITTKTTGLKNGHTM